MRLILILFVVSVEALIRFLFPRANSRSGLPFEEPRFVPVAVVTGLALGFPSFQIGRWACPVALPRSCNWTNRERRFWSPLTGTCQCLLWVESGHFRYRGPLANRALREALS